MADAPAGDPALQLRELLESSPLPLARFDLGTMLLTDANDAARDVLGVRRDANVFPLPLKKVIGPDDEAMAERSLKLVADGTIHAYDARRSVRRLDGSTIAGRVWVRALGPPNETSALVLFLPESARDLADDTPTPPATRLSLTGPVVVGSIDAATRIKQISSDAKALLKTKPETLLDVALVDLVHSDDIGTLLAGLGSAVSGDASVGVCVRMKRGNDSYAPVRVVLTPSRREKGTRFGFVLTPDTPPDSSRTDRVAELEQHLWRIAAEGVVDNLHRLPDHTELPGLEQLSTRQWQVLSGLLRGERVPEIAREMYVSQSTVRNHLANIFRTLGVHSQAELLALFRQQNARNV
jgi:DNA-binding CsgD family transcriptional regulator